MSGWFRLTLAIGCCFACGWAMDWKALRRQGCVSDYAAVVAGDSKAAIEQYCANVEASTGTRIDLVTLASLQSEPLADVARSIFEAWRNPRTERDRRVLVLLALSERRHYILAGDDFTPPVRNGLGALVLHAMRPALRHLDYADALRAAADTIGIQGARMAHVSEPTPLPRRWQPSFAGDTPWIVILVAVALVSAMVLVPAIRGLVRPRPAERSTWASRGSGGFGGYDSGDRFGGFGGSGVHDW